MSINITTILAIVLGLLSLIIPDFIIPAIILAGTIIILPLLLLILSLLYHSFAIFKIVFC